jgi:hypothetical protein
LLHNFLSVNHSRIHWQRRRHDLSRIQQRRRRDLLLERRTTKEFRIFVIVPPEALPFFSMAITQV